VEVDGTFPGTPCLCHDGLVSGSWPTKKEVAHDEVHCSADSIVRRLGCLDPAGIAASCGALTKFTPPSATVTSATEETGLFESPADGLGNTTKVTLPFCRVVGIAKSEPASHIGFELWLPPLSGTAGGWRVVISVTRECPTILH
jgi:hypothetical protein